MFSCFYHWLICRSQDERSFMHAVHDWHLSTLLCVVGMGVWQVEKTRGQVCLCACMGGFLTDMCTNESYMAIMMSEDRCVTHLKATSQWQLPQIHWWIQALTSGCLNPESCFNEEENTHTRIHTHTHNDKCLKGPTHLLCYSFISSPLLLPPSLSPGYFWLIDLSALLLNKWKLQLVPCRQCFHQHSAGSVWSGPLPPSCTSVELDELVPGNGTFFF